MFPEDKSKENILTIDENCPTCGISFREHQSKESLEKCSMVFTIKTHQLEYKLKLRALTK